MSCFLARYWCQRCRRLPQRSVYGLGAGPTVDVHQHRVLLRGVEVGGLDGVGVEGRTIRRRQGRKRGRGHVQAIEALLEGGVGLKGCHLGAVGLVEGPRGRGAGVGVRVDVVDPVLRQVDAVPARFLCDLLGGPGHFVPAERYANAVQMAFAGGLSGRREVGRERFLIDAVEGRHLPVALRDGAELGAVVAVQVRVVVAGPFG